MTKQRIDIIGRLGKDPETRKTQTGKSVTSFSLAVSEKHNDKETTTWFNCVAWDKAGEVIAQYVKKGDLLNVEGKIATRSYDDGGQTKHVWEVVVREFTLLGNKSQSKQSNDQSSGFDDMDDSIPF